jgi:hypothetical protein
MTGDLTGSIIANTYKDLLKIDAATSNNGLTGTLRNVQDGGGTAGPLQLSTAQLNVTGQFAVNGTVLTATVSQLNDIAAGSFETITDANQTVLITSDGVSVSTASTSASLKVNPDLSISSVTASIGSFTTSVSATNFVAATGSFTTKVSGVAAEFSGDVSANNVYAATNIYIAGTAIPNAEAVASVSARITSIGTVITSINSAHTSTTNRLVTASAALATSIANVSAAMATSIDNSNTNITTLTNARTSINAAHTSTTDRLVATSAALATSIANVSSTMATSIANVSSALAASIGNHLPKAGGAMTGVLSATDVYVSALAVGTNSLLGKDIHIEKSAVADIQALTDGTNISIDFNVGQNFTVTLAGNRTLDNPDNCVAGQVGSIFVVQDGTGSRTLAYGTSWDFPGGTAPTLSTDAAAIDRIDYIVHTSTDVHAVLTKAYS